jgi:hypothetical protein
MTAAVRELVTVDDHPIEDGVPMPKSVAGGRPAWERHPFLRMEVGQSFVFTLEEFQVVTRAKTRIHIDHRYGGEDCHSRFAVRKIDAGHFRCWRVA